ncbi:alpha-hydroxy acid oxidase [Gryllotalpicola ginsengisoli]|uniref:alpha-hydroxy acid oxidase n=1 Tax=Gryllotalpicola ginsengisoli TaxID=444608 RepID=UPI0003B45BBD|nr:alpha-hydroxy acid oxidase [Gryllotalpicola ginsengisoli]
MAVTRHLPTVRSVIAEAKANLSPRLLDYVEGGSSGESSLAANRAAFGLWSFDPDMLTGLSRPRLGIELLGMTLRMPVFASPFGYDKALHPAGYAAVARAIGEAGITGIVSESSSDSLVELAPEFAGQQGGVQVALVAEDEHVLGFEERAAAAGYRFLCFTDAPTRAWRERMRENGLDLNRYYGQGNYGPGGASRHALDELMNFTQPRWDWKRLETLAAKMTLPWVLKGVVSARDARRAVDAGAAGIYMSAYGGRNLDGMIAPLRRLEEVRAEVGPDVPILIDSGFRHGTDIAKALALGATAVGVGRLMAFGLAAGSHEDPSLGARTILQHLHDELESVMGSLGCETVEQIDRHHVVPAQP